MPAKKTRLSKNGNSVMRRSRLASNIKPEPFDKTSMTEQEVNLVKNRLSHGKYVITAVIQAKPVDGWKITPDQTRKGLNWLMSKWKTPKTGVESATNPFGYREQEVLKNFKEFRLIDFRDMATYQQTQLNIHNYVPVYRVIAKDGSTFEYNLDYSEKSGVRITG